MPSISEKWIVIRADANQHWDVGQNKLMSAPTVVLNRMPTTQGGPFPPTQVTFSVSDGDLTAWKPGTQVDAIFTSGGDPVPQPAVASISGQTTGQQGR